MQEQTSIHERLDSLERENRRWRRAGTLAALGCAAFFAMSIARPAPQDAASSNGVLRGEKLELTDANGEVYASIAIDGAGFPLFLMHKDAGHVAMTLNKPALHIRGGKGLGSAFVGFDTRDFAKMELTSGETSGGVRMAIRPNGDSGLYVLGEEGFDRAALEYLVGGHSTLTLRETHNRVRSALTVDPEGNSSAILLDSSGRRRVGMLVKPDGAPVISMEDESAVPRLNVSMEFDGSTSIEFMRPDGTLGKRIP